MGEKFFCFFLEAWWCFRLGLGWTLASFWSQIVSALLLLLLSPMLLAPHIRPGLYYLFCACIRIPWMFIHYFRFDLLVIRLVRFIRNSPVGKIQRQIQFFSLTKSKFLSELSKIFFKKSRFGWLLLNSFFFLFQNLLSKKRDYWLLFLSFFFLVPEWQWKGFKLEADYGVVTWWLSVFPDTGLHLYENWAVLAPISDLKREREKTQVRIEIAGGNERRSGPFRSQIKSS